MTFTKFIYHPAWNYFFATMLILISIVTMLSGFHPLKPTPFQCVIDGIVILCAGIKIMGQAMSLDRIRHLVDGAVRDKDPDSPIPTIKNIVNYKE